MGKVRLRGNWLSRWVGRADPDDGGSHLVAISEPFGSGATPAEETPRRPSRYRSPSRARLPVARFAFTGPILATTEGSVAFPSKEDIRELFDPDNPDEVRDLKAWQAFAYQTFHDSISDYADLEGEELADGIWRGFLSQQCEGLEIINHEIDLRAKRALRRVAQARRLSEGT